MAAPVFATNDVPTAAQFNDWLVNVNFARKSADTARTSTTTLTNDPHLSVAVQANAVYVVTCNLKYDGAAAGDLKVGWTVPSSASLDWTLVGLGAAAAAYTDDQVGGFQTLSTPTIGAIAAGTFAGLLMVGLLVTSVTAGSLVLQWAQGTSSGTATTVFANSFLSLDKKS